jgi:broad specificity phosphatase PhoE
VSDASSGAGRDGSGRTAGAGWPAQLTFVRHGESVGNIAAREADAAGWSRLKLEHRDADTPLSHDGRRQAEAVGAWWAELAKDQLPEVVVASPYRRALDTARTAVEAAGLQLEIVPDERLRERELGSFDGLTGHGIREMFPDEADRRRRTGKLYYRPPGGESWCDVALRVRSVIGTWREEYAGLRVAAFTHQAVIMSARFVLEGLQEKELLDADRGDPLANCAMTRYRSDGGAGSRGLVLEAYNDTTAVERSAAPTTREPKAEQPVEQAGDAADAETPERSHDEAVR